MTTEYKVNINDINYGGHMGNDRALAVFHQARIEFLTQFGYSELRIAEGIGIILKEANVKYKREVFLNDILNIEVKLIKTEGIKWTLGYTVRRNSDNSVVIEGHTVMVSYNYDSKKACRIPEKFIQDISQ